MSPAPAIDPALSLWSLLGPVLGEKSIVPPTVLVMAALPAVLVSENLTRPPLVMTALPAVLVSSKKTKLLLKLVMAALPAVLVSRNWTTPTLELVMAALPAVLV